MISCTFYNHPTISSSITIFLSICFSELIGATVRPFELKDRKYCIEVVANTTGKKGQKKYSFSVEREYDRKRWLEALARAAKAPSGDNPLHGAEGGGVAGSGASAGGFVASGKESTNTGSGGGLGAAASGLAMSASSITGGRSFSTDKPKPSARRGYLKKKSPSLMQGYQKRWFILQEPGQLVYFSTEEAHFAGEQPKGTINVAELLPGGKGVEVKNGELFLKLSSRTYKLKAKDDADARGWMEDINAWVLYLSSSD